MESTQERVIIQLKIEFGFCDKSVADENNDIIFIKNYVFIILSYRTGAVTLRLIPEGS